MTARRAISGLLLALSVLALYQGVAMLRACARIRGEYKRELNRILTELPVDLSYPGAARVRFRCDYPHGHGFTVALFGIDPPATGAQPPEQLDGLKATVAVLDGPLHAMLDHRPYAIDYTSGMLHDPAATGLISFGQQHRPGEYEIELVVEQPAPAMSGVAHRVVIYTQVCGCETLGCFIAVPIAGVLLFFAAVAGPWSGIAFFARARPQQRPQGQTSIADPAASTEETG